MNRLRFVWSRVWRVLSTQIVDVAVHAPDHVAMFAMDALRQLTVRFLEKEELSNYHFQVECLQPFEIVTRSPDVSREMVELVVRTLANLAHTRRATLKSGWRPVLGAVLQACTTVQTVPVLEAGG